MSKYPASTRSVKTKRLVKLEAKGKEEARTVIRGGVLWQCGSAVHLTAICQMIGYQLGGSRWVHVGCQFEKSGQEASPGRGSHVDEKIVVGSVPSHGINVIRIGVCDTERNSRPLIARAGIVVDGRLVGAQSPEIVSFAFEKLSDLCRKDGNVCVLYL